MHNDISWKYTSCVIFGPVTSTTMHHSGVIMERSSRRRCSTGLDHLASLKVHIDKSLLFTVRASVFQVNPRAHPVVHLLLLKCSKDNDVDTEKS